jgi:hypothetical protein
VHILFIATTKYDFTDVKASLKKVQRNMKNKQNKNNVIKNRESVGVYYQYGAVGGRYRYFATFFHNLNKLDNSEALVLSHCSVGQCLFGIGHFFDTVSAQRCQRILVNLDVMWC